MSPASVRRLPGVPGAYEVRGSPNDVHFGRRRIEELTVTGLDCDPDGLRAIAELGDLRVLRLERVTGVDLSPLAGTSVTDLTIDRAGDIDLSPLAGLGALEVLVLTGTRSCSLPDRLALSSRLRALALTSDGSDEPAEPIEALMNSIVWEDLSALETLVVALGAESPGEPAGIDLALLAHLTGLRTLDLRRGVRHAGPGASPIEPPFPGLPRSLTDVRVTASDAERVRGALSAYLDLPRWPDAGAPSVDEQRPDHGQLDSAGPGPFRPRPPGEDGELWRMYGSLFDVVGLVDGATEHDALVAFVEQLRAADPELLSRLDFDPESSGTAIEARTLSDLEAVRTHLGLRCG